jgi:methionine synthase II (cobalamin-independent)
MKRSTDRILTTHVGSLARPDALVPILRSKDRGQPYDGETYTRLVREAVADVVRRQAEAGIDVVTDGEQGKASFFGYVVERFTGFERKPAPPGQEGSTRAASREYRDFPDYYAWSERIAEWAGGRGGDRRHGVAVCTGPVSYRGHAAIQADIDNLKAAVKGQRHEDVFMPAIAPSYIFATLPNEFYRTAEEYEQALADALREEYRAIVDAGFVLQVDDPRLVTYYMMNPDRDTSNDIWASDLHVTPDDKFLYAAERTGSSIGAFSVDTATGKLTYLSSTPTENQPRGFRMDPKGRHVVVSGEKSDTRGTHPWTEAPTIPASTADSSASRSAGPGQQTLLARLEERAKQAAPRRARPVARAHRVAHEPPLAVDQIDGGRPPHAVAPARHLTAQVDEHAAGVAALAGGPGHERGILAEAHEQQLEPFRPELPVVLV